jgi:hypothetical protein
MPRGTGLVDTMASGTLHTRRLGADDNALSARRLLLVVVLVLRRALGRIIAVAAARAAAVELHAVARARNAVALARAAAGAGADRGRGRRVGGARRQAGHVRVVVRVEVRVVVGAGRVGGRDGLAGEARGERLHGGLAILRVDYLAGLVRALRLGRDNLRGRDGAALGDGSGAYASAMAGGGLLGRGRGLGLAGDVEDVEFAASGGFCGVFFGGIMRDVVAVDDVVVPVPLALLQCVALKLEASHPSAALLGVLGERELSCVVVPGAEQVHCLAAAGCAKREVELDSCHCEVPIRLFLLDLKNV